MLANYDPDRNIEDLTDTEIYAAIRYLESDTSSSTGQKDDTPAVKQNLDEGVVVCVCLYIAVLIGLAFLWFYSR